MLLVTRFFHLLLLLPLVSVSYAQLDGLSLVNISKLDTSYNVTIACDVIDGTNQSMVYSFNGFLQSVCFADSMCYINPETLLDGKAIEIKKSMDSLAQVIFNRKLIFQRALYCK